MAKTSKVSQKKWVKGVNAAAQSFAQPPGSFPRASNLVYVHRGALNTCDGSQLISAFNGAVQPLSTNLGPFIDIFLYQPIGGANVYYALAKDFNTHLGAPTTLAAAVGAAGGLTGVYFWVVTALDGAGGETTISNEATQTLAAQKANLTWTAVTYATGYNIYRTVAGGASGTEHFVATVATNSYIDNIADGSLGTTTPPASNNTQVTQFYQIPVTSFGAANIVKTFPADPVPPPNSFDGTGGGSGGGGGGGGSGTGGGGAGGSSPAGGTVGNVSPIPLIIQFKNLMILLLGNGMPPYSSDGTTPNTIALVNNFQASYASRTASTAQNVGDQISVTISAVNYVFTVTQAGITGAGGAPAFSANLGSIVADGTVYWKNTGAVAAVTPPRGAAHGIIYAGSLWIGNTSPTTTSDNFDGPSCLKMSDLNNPNSWNPLNVAFLDRDDGTQITGLATFTIAESGIPPVGSLVAFKDFSTFQINGVFGASNFSIARAQTDMGCSAARTIQFVPGFGIVRMTHLGFAMFDGVRDRLLSEEIRPYIFGGEPDIQPIDWNFVYFSKGSQTASPPMYVCACPITTVASTPTTPFTIGASAIAGSLISGTYYVVIRYIDVNTGVLFQSNEVSFTGTGVQLTGKFNYTNQLYQVYIGTTAGQENQFLNTRAALFPGGGGGGIRITSLVGFQPSTLNSSFGHLTRIFCYDLVLKAWAIVDLPFPISVLRQFRTIGSIPITVMGGYSDGGVRRWLGGAGFDLQWDAGAVNNGAVNASVAWAVRTPEVFGKDASDRVYFRQLALRGRGNPTGIMASVAVSGNKGIAAPTRNLSVLPMAGGEFTAYADIGVTGVDAYATLSGSGPIELDSVDWFAVAKAIRGKVTV